MDEVPASPELVKKRKSRRKTLHFKQRTSLTLNRDRPPEVQQQHSIAEDDLPDDSRFDEPAEESNVEPEIPHEINLLYFDVDTMDIAQTNEDPLVAAAIIEKANKIEPENTTRPSKDFLANVQKKFVRVEEVIEPDIKPEPVDSVSETAKEANAVPVGKKANYSYTQFDLDTQMIGICEAADIIAGLNTNPEHELNDWSSPLKQQEEGEIVQVKPEPQSQVRRPETPIKEERRRDRWSNVRQSSLSRKSILIQECRTPPSTGNVKKCISMDFSDDSDNELTIDFSKIKSSQLRRRLEKIQSYIESPPQAVRKTATRRTFSKKKLQSPHTPVAVRRLSYESTYSDRTNGNEQEPVRLSSDEEMDCLNETQQNHQPESQAVVDSSPEGDNFDSSLLIKANINQLSQFFSQSVPSATKPKPDSESLTKEPPFFGFPPEPSSPISLTSDPGGSPKVLNIAWLFRNDSETESEGELTRFTSEEHIHRLLDDDDDFLVQMNPANKKEEPMETVKRGSPNEKKQVFCDADFVMPLPPVQEYGNRPNTLSASLATECDLPPTSNDTWEPHVFPSAGNIEVKISDITLAKARTICDEKERKYDKDKAMCNASRVETCAVSIPEKPSFGGFCTAGGNKVHISVEALAKAEQLWKENEENVDMNSPYGSIIGGSDWPKPTKINDKPEIAQQSFDGFQTAGGSRVQASEKALTKARHILDQIESEIETEDEVPDNRGGDCFGFQTAGGSTIKVSDNAMSKAQSILRQIELAMENEISVTDEDPPSKREPINVSDSIKAQAIFREIENESTKAEPSNSIKRLRDANGCGTETPPKKYKPEIICNNVVNNISTSTPNLHGKTTNSSVHQNGKHELDHFFGDLDDHEFQQLFCGSEATAPYSRRVRPMKQVRLSNRFDECDKAHADDHHVPGEAHWDDSFGDVVAKLNSDGGLKVAPHIAEARKLSMQRQQSYIESKPLEERRPRLTEFISKKQMRGRSTLRQFVENRNPSCSVPEKLRDVIADNAMNFKFDMIEFYTKTECLENVDGIVLGDSNTTTLFFNERCQAGLPEFKLAFLASPGIDPALVPAGWIENCWVWTIIKLTSMERNLPDYFHGITTLENMLNQIMYRYHLEIDSAKRSVIRKMLEKDDIASKRMVLFVSRIFRGSDPFEVEIELCDGWYPIRSVLDFPLTQAILNGKITIGTKLMIQGAELLNLNEGCSPLEVPADVRLKIHANSTRRTRWDTRLGLFKVPLNFVISANDVLDRGGLIVSLEVIILRVYPLMFVDKTQRDALGSVLRSERVERRRTLESDSNRFESFQALFSQIQKDVQAEKVQPNGRRLISKLTRATTTAELVELMEAGLDVSCLEIELTSTQREAIMDHQRRKQEECIQEVNRRIKERMSSGESKRKVSSLLKMRITDARKPEKVLLLSIWRPPEELCDLFQETKVLEIRNVTANGTRNGEVQLTAGKNSSFKPLDQRQRELPVQQMRTLTRIADIETSNFRPMFNEFDTIGIVILVGAIESKKFQTVYLADIDKNLLCVNFWSGIKEYAYEDVVRERVVLCISNLQWRTINALSVIPTAFATEYTTFSEHSKSKHFVEEFQSLHATLKDVNLEVFYDECRFKIAELKDKKLPRYNGFQTPLRKSSTTTPMRCIPGASMNANTATPSDFSPGVGQPVSLQKRKLEQLAAYNSPPKLSPIIMRYNPRVRKNFKTPAKLEDRINQIGEDDSLC